MIQSPVQKEFQEFWYLKLCDPIHQRAFWLRFNLFTSRNGFKKISEIWAIFFQKELGRETRKLAVRQSFDMKAFTRISDFSIQIGNSELKQNSTQGSAISKGNSIQWDLSFHDGHHAQFALLPKLLSRTGVIRNSLTTLSEDSLFSGTVEINNELTHWKEAPGIWGHFYGKKNNHSWVWGHCNSFVNEQGQSTNFIFEGLSTRAKAGPLILPKLSSFYFYYQGKDYYFNSIKDAIFAKSNQTLKEWNFQVDHKDISFRGYAKSEFKDFAGLMDEDTNGSLLYLTHAELSDLRILVYRNGKLVDTFNAIGTMALEFASRTKNPYVPLLV